MRPRDQRPPRGPLRTQAVTPDARRRRRAPASTAVTPHRYPHPRVYRSVGPRGRFARRPVVRMCSRSVGSPRPAGVLPRCEDPTVRAGAVSHRRQAAVTPHLRSSAKQKRPRRERVHRPSNCVAPRMPRTTALPSEPFRADDSYRNWGRVRRIPRLRVVCHERNREFVRDPDPTQPQRGAAPSVSVASTMQTGGDQCLDVARQPAAPRAISPGAESTPSRHRPPRVVALACSRV